MTKRGLFLASSMALLLWVHGGSNYVAGQPSTPPLYHAIRNGDLKQIKTLLDKGANPNVPDNLGYAPLMHALLTEVSSLELVKLLLEHGADAKAKAKDGFTALSFAKRKGWHEVVMLLVKAGATE
jgi:ankyrin repeat protein